MSDPLHIRTQIRNYVCNRLVGKTDAGNRVYESKVTPNQGPFPIIGVYTLADTKTADRSEAPYEETRNITLEVQIEHMATGNPSFAADLDAICLRVESLIDYKLGGRIQEIQGCKYRDTNVIFKDDGEKMTAVAAMSFDVVYDWTEPNFEDPAVLDDLKWIYNTYDLADPNNGSGEGPDGQIDAQDIVGDLSE
jgi:hypothetical protein